MTANAQKLAAALRSGEFKQGRGALRVGDEFCCLGVACELYRRENGGEWDRGEFFGEGYFLPLVVRDWLGFASVDGSYGTGNSLATDNDDCKSFEDIAVTIERDSGLYR